MFFRIASALPRYLRGVWGMGDGGGGGGGGEGGGVRCLCSCSYEARELASTAWEGPACKSWPTSPRPSPSHTILNLRPPRSPFLHCHRLLGVEHVHVSLLVRAAKAHRRITAGDVAVEQVALVLGQHIAACGGPGVVQGPTGEKRSMDVLVCLPRSGWASGAHALPPPQDTLSFAMAHSHLVDACPQAVSDRYIHEDLAGAAEGHGGHGAVACEGVVGLTPSKDYRTHGAREIAGVNHGQLPARARAHTDTRITRHHMAGY
jgi:hypothetical protein